MATKSKKIMIDFSITLEKVEKDLKDIYEKDDLRISRFETLIV